jgi:methionine aminopeptidase
LSKQSNMTRKKLEYAQLIAIDFFTAIEKNKLIVAGKSEKQLADEVCELGLTEFGIEQHWHKKIVRSGPNTLAAYPDNPPNRIIEKDDIVFIDLGPVINEYETDIGRTYVLGGNALKLKLKNDVEKVWYEIQSWFWQHTTLRASAIYEYAVKKTIEYGWEFGGAIAGHIIGKFPHEQPEDPNSIELDIHPDNDYDVFLTDANGESRNWILELQFIDKKYSMGSYFEQML